jgi:hypothetical protein
VLLGYDGVWLFSWTKRAYEWTDEDTGKRSATSYTLLNPYAHPPAEFAALWQFRREIASHEALLQSTTPYRPSPRVRFLHSFANERAHKVMPTAREQGRATYAALRYSHLPLGIVTERMVRAGMERTESPGRTALILSGLTVLERETLPALHAYVSSGNSLLIVNAPLRMDHLGGSIGAPWLTGSMTGRDDRDEVTMVGVPEVGLPGKPVGYAFQHLRANGAEEVYRDNLGAPRVVCREIGNGRVYTVCFAGRAYALLRVLLAVLDREGFAAPWHLFMEDTRERAVNVLMSVRRGLRAEAVLLANQDLYQKRVRFTWPTLHGTWRASLYLGEQGDGAAGTFTGEEGIAFDLPGEGVRLLVLQREETDQ